MEGLAHFVTKSFDRNTSKLADDASNMANNNNYCHLGSDDGNLTDDDINVTECDSDLEDNDNAVKRSQDDEKDISTIVVVEDEKQENELREDRPQGCVVTTGEFVFPVHILNYSMFRNLNQFLNWHKFFSELCNFQNLHAFAK